MYGLDCSECVCEGVQRRMLWPELNMTQLWILVYEFGRSLLSMLDRFDNRLQDSRIGE